MISRVLISKAGQLAATGLVGTGVIMSGTEVAREMNLFKSDGFPTVLKVAGVGTAAILGGIFSPGYVPVRIYQFCQKQQKTKF